MKSQLPYRTTITRRTLLPELSSALLLILDLPALLADKRLIVHEDII